MPSVLIDLNAVLPGFPGDSEGKPSVKYTLDASLLKNVLDRLPGERIILFNFPPFEDIHTKSLTSPNSLASQAFELPATNNIFFRHAKKKDKNRSRHVL